MNLHGGDIYGVTHGGNELLDYSSNINPYGPPPAAIAAAQGALGRVNRYPDAKQRALKGAYSKALKVGEDNLVFGNGASELIKAAFEALRPQRVVLTTPTFLEYERCARQCGVEVISCAMSAENGFAPPIDELRKIVMPGDMLVVCQPNNPTGRAWSREELDCAFRLTESGWIMIDECFVDLCSPAVASSIDGIGAENLLVVRALTKNFSAPGLRVGYVVAGRAIVEKITDAIQPWPVNAVGEAFAVACAEGMDDFLVVSRSKILSERTRIVLALSEMGLEVFPSCVNYMLLRSPIEGEKLARRMLDFGILIRRCANFPGLDDNYVRVAVKDKSSNDELIAAFRSAL